MVSINPLTEVQTWTQTAQTTGDFRSFFNTGTQLITGGNSNNGIYKSTDNGNTWTLTAQTTGSFFSFLNTGTQLITGGNSNNGIYKSTDNGTHLNSNITNHWNSLQLFPKYWHSTHSLVVIVIMASINPLTEDKLELKQHKP